MALTVEDGTIVANANTYISDVNFTDYCDARGLTYPATSAARENLIIRAKDYLESFRDRYQGLKTDSAQALQWPRSNVFIDTYGQDANSIPQLLKDAQCRVAYDLQNGDFEKAGGVRETKREEVAGAVSIEYFQTSSSLNVYRSLAVENLLRPLFMSSGMFRTVRV